MNIQLTPELHLSLVFSHLLQIRVLEMWTDLDLTVPAVLVLALEQKILVSTLLLVLKTAKLN